MAGDANVVGEPAAAPVETVMRPVGETEFVNGMAAICASGYCGKTKVAAGIVGYADLRLGSRVEPVLAALLRAGGDRFRHRYSGIRKFQRCQALAGLFGQHLTASPEQRYRNPDDDALSRHDRLSHRDALLIFFGARVPRQ